MRKLIVTALLLALSGAGSVAAGTGEDADAAYGRGDLATAARLYGVLAAQGMASAQFNLGVLYDFGQGVPKDPAMALQWYRAAAAQGHAAAQFNLGGMYFDGQGVAPDQLRAYVWFTLAAIAGAPGASRNRNALVKLLDAKQLEEAQRMVRDCQARNFKNCD
jgi:TPR repeat protein